jgi:hypothetical protein
MISGLYRLIVAAADWRPRDALVGIAIAAIVAVFATVSVGFATVAAYLHFESTSGPVVASLVISAAYAAAATAGICGLLLRRRRPLRRDVPDQAPTAQLEAVLQSIAAANGAQDAASLASALSMGRDMSSMERLAVALVSGFFAGRKLDR